MKYEIPMTPGACPPVIHVSQGDIGRVVELALVDAPTSVSYSIRGQRPDGAGVSQTVSASGGVITWTISAPFTEIEGDCICEIFADGNGKKIGSQNFILMVEKAARPSDAPAPWSNITITENGTYNCRPYAEVTVDVDAPEPTGTKLIEYNGEYNIADFARVRVAVEGGGVHPEGTREITANGSYDVTNYERARVNVPGIVPSGTLEVSENGLFSISEYEKVRVNVDAGGDVAEIVTQGRTGTYTLSNVISSLRSYAFAGTSFSSIEISAEMINGQCFEEAAASTITVHGVTDIDSLAFYAARSLTALHLDVSAVPTLYEADAFNGTPIKTGGGTIYVPAALEAAFKSATNWSAFASQIVGE